MRLTIALYILLFSALQAVAQTQPLRIGYLGSLSGFAASYGKTVLEGAELAASELKDSAVPVVLSIEDDASDTRNAVSAYQKLRAINSVQAVIGGSWWANAIVKPAENDNVLLLSCETIYDDDVVPGRTYFIMTGDLAAWVRAHEPVVKARGFKRGAIVRFTSGFGATLEKEMRKMFSADGRQFAGAIEYSDIQILDAGSLLLRLKQLNPDVVYFDMQPNGGANLFKKLHELGLQKRIAVLTHSAAYDMLQQKLIDPALLGEVYFTRRETYEPDFVKKFQARYQREPELGADLGYYSLHLLKQALAAKDPLAALKSNSLSVDGKIFTFDQNNVYPGPREVVWTVRQGKAVKYE